MPSFVFLWQSTIFSFTFTESAVSPYSSSLNHSSPLMISNAMLLLYMKKVKIFIHISKFNFLLYHSLYNPDDFLSVYLSSDPAHQNPYSPVKIHSRLGKHFLCHLPQLTNRDRPQVQFLDSGTDILLRIFCQIFQ